MTGGQSLAPEQLPELIKRLAEETQHPRSAAGDEEDLLGHVGVLPHPRRRCSGVEWYLRKRWGLV